MGSSPPSKHTHPNFAALQSSKITVPSQVELGTKFTVYWEKPESTLGGKHCDKIGYYSADPKEPHDSTSWHGILPLQRYSIKSAKGEQTFDALYCGNSFVSIYIGQDWRGNTTTDYWQSFREYPFEVVLPRTFSQPPSITFESNLFGSDLKFSLVLPDFKSYPLLKPELILMHESKGIHAWPLVSGTNNCCCEASKISFVSNYQLKFKLTDTYTYHTHEFKITPPEQLLVPGAVEVTAVHKVVYLGQKAEITWKAPTIANIERHLVISKTSSTKPMAVYALKEQNGKILSPSLSSLESYKVFFCIGKVPEDPVPLSYWGFIEVETIVPDFYPSDDAPRVANKTQKKKNIPPEESFLEPELEERIGEGAYAQVYKAKLQNTPVAVKLFKSTPRTDGVIQWGREQAILQKLRHVNIVLFLGSCYCENQYGIVMELMDLSLAKWMVEEDSIEGGYHYTVKKKILLDICNGLEYLHSLGADTYHGDVKPDNILMNRQLNGDITAVKICDLQQAKIKTFRQNSVSSRRESIYTLNYAAPELIKPSGVPPSSSVDIFSLGIIIWELCSANTPYIAVSGDLEKAILNGTRPDPNRLFEPWVTLKQIVEQCWSANVDVRPTVKEVSQIIRQIQ